MRLIINELGLDNEFIMEKYRLNLILGDIDISIDELPFGIFIELEGEEDEIHELAKKLDLKEKIIVTYWHIFERWKKENGREDFGENIVFEKDYTPLLKNG